MHSLSKLKNIGLLLVIILVVSAYVTQERRPASTTVNIGFIGDSITEAAYIKTGPGAAEVAILGNGYAGINRGVGGTTTRDWRPEGQMYANALAAFKSQNAHVVSIMLGTNDARENVAASPEEYGRNLRRIISALLASGTIQYVIVNYPPYTVPHPDGLWHADSIARLEGYMKQINALTQKPGVLLGDTSAYDYFKHHQKELKDGIHPTQSGAWQLGRLWAQAYLRAMHVVVREKHMAALGFTRDIAKSPFFSVYQ